MIVVGKDVLELLSSAMYVDPLAVYREYVQNAADAIDEARALGHLGPQEAGRVDIEINGDERRIRIRDNGAGLPVRSAVQRLLAIGASTKRGTRARGFRGVGRLAGLAFGRSLVFRTRAVGDPSVIEVRWDCQRLKAVLRDVAQSDDISSVIQRVVSIQSLPEDDWPAHFFEVELTDVIRTRRDSLLSPAIVSDYLSEVAPIPLDEAFRWEADIGRHLDAVRLGGLEVRVSPDAKPLRRPFRNRFKVSEHNEDQFEELELLTLADLDGGVAAVGWVLHHNYLGSISVRSRIGGLRVRVGNVQIGDETLLEDIFAETRFNGWAVGELHVLDPRILPNARRDQFEQNVHYSNFTAQLEPLARQIAKRARSASISRNQARKSERLAKPASSGSSEARLSPAASGVETMGAVEPATERSRAHLSPAQRQLVRKMRALIERSGLRPSDVSAVVDALK